MKNALILFVLLMALVGGCRKNTDIGPSDLLYQRWHLDRVKRVGDSVWVSYDTDGFYDAEYRPDGTLVHRKDGIVKPTSCCEAGHYERNGVVISYTDFPSCPSVRCSFVSSGTINIMRENLLEIQTGDRINQYTPVK